MSTAFFASLKVLCLTLTQTLTLVILQDYNTYLHVPSDIPLDHRYLDASNTNMQSYLDQIALWTSENLMKLNPDKSSYAILSRAKEDFVTRLTINGTKIAHKT